MKLAGMSAKKSAGKWAGPVTPVRIPRAVRTLVVFGGLFDPPHFYHTLAPLMVNRMYGEKGRVLYVPAARSPLKAGGPVASDEQRLAMLKLALDTAGSGEAGSGKAGSDELGSGEMGLGEAGGSWSIWTDEIDRAAWLRERGRDGPSYTIETLRRLRRVVPERVKMRLLIGADQAADFHKWKEFRAIIKLAEPLVMAREPVVTAAQLFASVDNGVWKREERVAWCTRMAPNVPMKVASTGLREAIKDAPRDAEKWAKRPPLDRVRTSVAAYIIEHGLYGVKR